MANARPGTDDLNIAGASATLTAGAVSMRYGAFTDVKDDLDIPVSMHREAAPGCDFTIVPHDQRPQPSMSGIASRLHDEVVAGLQPPDVVRVETELSSVLNHDRGGDVPSI